MERGKASGEDGLVAEHLKYAHLAQTKLLVKLLNYILLYGLVPSLFGICITISILKESNAKSRLSTDEFWGITVSPVLPKVFEQALLFNFENYFVSSDEQFRFKKAIGCNHAILAVKSTIDHFVKHGSTVNICRLDISKAVDKIQHCILFDKLIKHCIPISLVNVLLFWYSNSICKVKWLHAFSFSYTFGAGVRQGGVLSPISFSVYVEDLLQKLHASNFGCSIAGLCLNSIMYADDLILLSLSVTELQHMVDLCVCELNDVHLSVNPKKFYCLRIG